MMYNDVSTPQTVRKRGRPRKDVVRASIYIEKELHDFILRHKLMGYEVHYPRKVTKPLEMRQVYRTINQYINLLIRKSIAEFLIDCVDYRHPSTPENWTEEDIKVLKMVAPDTFDAGLKNWMIIAKVSYERKSQIERNTHQSEPGFSRHGED